MTLVKADQVRTELFRRYNAQIAALLGETVDDPSLSGAEMPGPEWPRRFRVSYARQRLMYQRCLLPVPEVPSVEEAEPLDYDEVAERERIAEEDNWRSMYDPPFPALRRVMRRIQDKALETLIHEAAEAPECVHGDEYAAQRMAVLLRMEEHNGRERIKRMAKEHEMTWTLPNAD